MKVEVHLLGGTRKVIDIDPSATRGATVGVNVWNQDGTLFVPAAGGGGSGVSVTAWELILNIPPNVVALANVSGTGIYVITGAGTSEVRSLPDGTGFSWTNGNGVSGDPTLALNANLQAWSAITTASKEPAITAGTTAQFWRGDKTWSNTLVGPIGIGGLDAGAGVGVLAYLANVTTPPSANPVGGGILYVEAGALKYRGSGGTVTVIAPA